VLAIDTTPLRRPRRLPAFLAIALVTSVVGAAGMLVAARGVVDEVPRVPGVAQVLSSTSTNVENYLLVGSDSRDLGDPNTGDTGGVTGNRSDTMMVLRIDKNDDTASLLSIPRDLYVDTPDHTGRINGAYNDGPAALVVAIQQALSLPIHHYVEIDFSGFKALVEALDGISVCFLVSDS
jgi:anionic cell wall polymer biosynthesis LytR-Cps2A-Psr (LCP) family protein